MWSSVRLINTSEGKGGEDETAYKILDLNKKKEKGQKKVSLTVRQGWDSR